YVQPYQEVFSRLSRNFLPFRSGGANEMKYSTRLLVVRCLICAAVLIPLLALQSMQSSAVFAQSISFLRIIHASPDIGIVDVFVDKKEFINSFEYANVTDYIPIPPGSHMLQVALLGK